MLSSHSWRLDCEGEREELEMHGLQSSDKLQFWNSSVQKQNEDQELDSPRNKTSAQTAKPLSKKFKRQAWVFGMICRTTRRLFLNVRPRDSEGKYKRTRRDPCQCQAKNQLLHRRLASVNHDLNYCIPNEPSINTNTFEGLWAQINRWLPKGGSYNLTEYLELFQWFYQQKLNGKNPFWRLLELIAESNSYESVNDAQVDEVADVNGAEEDDEQDGMNISLFATRGFEMHVRLGFGLINSFTNNKTKLG